MKDEKKYIVDDKLTVDEDSTESMVVCNSEEQFDIVLDIVKTHTDKSIV